MTWLIALVLLDALAPYPFPHFTWRGKFRAWHAFRLGRWAFSTSCHPWGKHACGGPARDGRHWHAHRVFWRLYYVDKRPHDPPTVTLASTAAAEPPRDARQAAREWPRRNRPPGPTVRRLGPDGKWERREI